MDLDFDVEEANSALTLLLVDDKTAVDEKPSVINLEEKIHINKQNLIEILGKTYLIEKERCYYDTKLLQKTQDFQLRKKHLEEKSKELNEDFILDIKQKSKEFEEINYSMLHLKNDEEKTLNHLKLKRKETQTQAMNELKKLKGLRMSYLGEHYCLIDKLEMLKRNTDNENQIKKFKEQISELQKNYQTQLNSINDLEKKLLYIINTGNVDPLLSDESVTDSEVCASLQSTKDKITTKTKFIKSTIGKPLVQALAAIVVYQPSDPIYYLANYLLHYHSNEKNAFEKQKHFEELMKARNRYSRDIKLSEECRLCINKEELNC